MVVFYASVHTSGLVHGATGSGRGVSVSLDMFRVCFGSFGGVVSFLPFSVVRCYGSVGGALAHGCSVHALVSIALRSMLLTHGICNSESHVSVVAAFEAEFIPTSVLHC